MPQHALPADRLPSGARSPYLVAASCLLLPGGGYFLLGRRLRGALVLATVLLSFAIGIAMRGPVSSVTATPDFMARLMQFAALIGDLGSGLLFLLTIWFGYSQPDVPGFAHDYGSKFIIAAGLLNLLAMTDVYEIAAGKKE